MFIAEIVRSSSKNCETPWFCSPAVNSCFCRAPVTCALIVLTCDSLRTDEGWSCYEDVGVIHPRKLTWNQKILVGKGETSTNHQFLSSMSVFGGVPIGSWISPGTLNSRSPFPCPLPIPFPYLPRILTVSFTHKIPFTLKLLQPDWHSTTSFGLLPNLRIGELLGGWKILKIMDFHEVNIHCWFRKVGPGSKFVVKLMGCNSWCFLGPVA